MTSGLLSRVRAIRERGPFRLMPLATLDQLKRRIHTTGGGASPASETTLLEELLAAAERRVRIELQDRTLDPQNNKTRLLDAARVVHLPDLRAATTVKLGGTVLTADQYRLSYPFDDGSGTIRYLRLKLGFAGSGEFRLDGTGDPWHDPISDGFAAQVEITGDWGPATEDPAIRDAVLTWAARAFHARNARFGDAVQDPAGGIASYFKQIPADVAVVLNAYRVPGL